MLSVAKLTPGQEGYYVPGEAWGALRYQDYALLKGYRQIVDQTYINPQDNRMTPNTFEGVTLGGKVAWVQYLGGYLWQIKPRNAEVYVDGYYVGLVDEFDGLFQRLHIESGAHRVEVRAAGYETLQFDVRISFEHTTTYQGEMRRIQ